MKSSDVEWWEDSVNCHEMMEYTISYNTYLCCKRSLFSLLKIKSENALCNGDIPVDGSMVWQIRFEACPVALSFSSTRIHSSCINDSW